MLGWAGIGVAQWLRLYPYARWLRAYGRPERAKGVISGGWMIFLINAGCWGLFGGAMFFLR